MLKRHNLSSAKMNDKKMIDDGIWVDEVKGWEK
jgi:hypothetical protein